MESAKLFRLPFDTLQEIAGYLHETHRPSLYTFGLASKTCYRATLQSVFQEVHLTVSCPKALQASIDTLAKVLSSTQSAKYVRHLSIKGFLHWNTDGSDKIEEAAMPNSDIEWFSGITEVLGDEEPNLDEDFFLDTIIEVSPEEEAKWEPVVQLVKTLPYLTKLVYNCSNQLPPRLLDALHKYQPQCKLHHLTFQLRSLQSTTIHPHEMAIITSPCLYSIRAQYAGFRDSNGCADFHKEAIQDLVAGLAPNLKEVWIAEVLAGPANVNAIYWNRTIRKPWRGLPGFIPGRVGLLTSLSLVGLAEFQPALQIWNQRTEFSSLNHLTLGGGITSNLHGITSEVMQWIVQNCSLPRLETLRIRLDYNGKNDLDNGKPNYTSSAVTFFEALEPLRELLVDGPLEPEILNVILSQHGHTLRKLGLCPTQSLGLDNQWQIPMVFEKAHILQIQDQCPKLQDLAISIKRTQSDAREVEIYESLGNMERLQFLFLILDCSNWQVARDGALTNDLLVDEEDLDFYFNTNTVIRKGHIREAFINCAVDETLARSIWGTICHNKTGKRLESLKIYTTGGSSFSAHIQPSDIWEVVDNLSRSWLIERSIRDDEDSINVKELGREAREARDRAEIENERSKGLADHSPVHIFHRIWASKEGNKDWRQDWTSFPLCK
jgi:hypothetical protein